MATNNNNTKDESREKQRVRRRKTTERKTYRGLITITIPMKCIVFCVHCLRWAAERIVTMIHVVVNTYLKFSSQWAEQRRMGRQWRILIYCARTRLIRPICTYINEKQIIICQFDWKTKTLLNSDGLFGWAVQSKRLKNGGAAPIQTAEHCKTYRSPTNDGIASIDIQQIFFISCVRVRVFLFHSVCGCCSFLLSLRIFFVFHRNESFYEITKLIWKRTKKKRSFVKS